MKFFKFYQNKSGGCFDQDDKLCHIVVIEAETYEEAEKKALEIGIYFNGVEDDIDCECCGDRWYHGDEIVLSNYKNSDETIMTIEQYAQYYANLYRGWTKPELRIFYHDGRIKEF